MSSLADIQHAETLAKRAHAVDIFSISPLISTRTPIAPEKIETFSEVEKRHIAGRKEIDALFAALAESRPQPARQPVEYRYKVVAYDASGARIAEIYASAISRFGRYGENAYFESANDDFRKCLAELTKTAVGH